MPVPVVVEAVAVERPRRRGSEPDVVAHVGQVGVVVRRLDRGRLDVELVLLAGRHRAVGVLADRRARLEAEAPRHVDLADAAVLDELDGLDHGRAAAVHGTDLHQLAVPLGGLHHLSPLPHGVGGGLLDIHVLAGLQAPDGGQRVPVVGRGDDDRVDVLVVEDAAQVTLVAGPESRDVLELRVLRARGEQVLVDVAERLDLHVGQAGEAPLQGVPLSADADARHDDAVVGSHHARAHRGAGAGFRRAQRRLARRHAGHGQDGAGSEVAP